MFEARDLAGTSPSDRSDRSSIHREGETDDRAINLGIVGTILVVVLIIAAILTSSGAPDARRKELHRRVSSTAYGLLELGLRHARAPVDATLSRFVVQLPVGTATFAAVGAEPATSTRRDVVHARATRRLGFTCPRALLVDRSRSDLLGRVFGLPRSSRLSLMWRYCRSRFEFQAVCGMRTSSRSRHPFPDGSRTNRGCALLDSGAEIGAQAFQRGRQDPGDVHLGHPDVGGDLGLREPTEEPEVEDPSIPGGELLDGGERLAHSSTSSIDSSFLLRCRSA